MILKSLLDIQQDVRRLEKSIYDISLDVKNINADIDKLRNSSVDEYLDFKKIESLSKNIKFDTHPLYKLKDGRQSQVYLEMLLNIVHIDIADQEAAINRMVFVQWLQKQANIDWSLEKLYVDSFSCGKESYHTLLEDIPDKYREHFILDALMVANIAGTANIEVQEYIVDLATLLGIDAEKIRKLAVIAKASLCQSFAKIPRDLARDLMSNRSFKHYLPANLFPEIEKSLRNIVLEISDDVYGFKWKVKQNETVEEGEIIASYLTRGHVTRNIKSTVSGTIFQFKDNRKYYGVVSFEKDNKDSIKAWVKKERLK